jgi:hypothetical protein
MILRDYAYTKVGLLGCIDLFLFLSGAYAQSIPIYSVVDMNKIWFVTRTKALRSFRSKLQTFKDVSAFLWLSKLFDLCKGFQLDRILQNTFLLHFQLKPPSKNV